MIPLTFKFETRQQAEKFLSWLCDGGGEQNYWSILELRPNEEDLVKFDYDFRNLVVDCKPLRKGKKKK